jgi:Spy/CpxP family protein refolding chaperone
MKKVAILMIITVFALTGVATAKGPGRGGPADGPRRDGQKEAPGMFWEKERVVEALSLTEDEQSKLAEMHSANRETVQGLREEMRVERQALREIFQSEGFSSSDAKNHFQEAEKTRSRLNNERFELQIQQRQLLGQERFAKLRKMEKRGMERRRGAPSSQ